MDGAQEPSQGDGVIQKLKAVPCLGGAGNVDQRQHDAGKNLENENGQGSAAEDVEPARRLARHWMFGSVADGSADLQPLLKPVADSA